MTTRPQPATHFSRLLDSGSPPVKPTFWDNLGLDNRRASVEQKLSWEFNHESAWNPIGPVNYEWSESLYSRAIKPLLQHNTKVIYKGFKKQTPYSVCCWMIGQEWHSLHPAAIFICGNEVTKNAVKLIERHGELARTWGFRVYGYKSKVSTTIGASVSEGHNESYSLVMPGMRFYVGNQDGISTRIATLGGSIKIDTDLYGLTVAQPFIGTFHGRIIRRRRDLFE